MEFVKNYLKTLKKEIDTLKHEDIVKAVDVLFDAWKKGKQVFIFGNGGSASTASHFACDLGKGTLQRVYDPKEKRFRVMSLTDNVAIMTAFANDLGYDDVFVQQLNNLVNSGDVVIGITGSGNSPNVVKAMEFANSCGATTIAFLGFDGGKTKEISDYHILFKSRHYGRLEDAHLILEHLITSYLKERINEFYNKNKD